jgi:glutathione S-transferase
MDPARAARALVDFSPGNVHGLLLYDYGASPCARRCRITLIEKGLRWDTQIVDLSRLEQRNPAYLALNPNGFVPTLAHGERVVYESNVITEYLDDAFPDPPLYPDDPWQLARVKMWQSAEAAMAKDYRTLMYQRLMGPILRLTRSRQEALDAVRRSTSDPADIAWEERVFDLAVLTPREERQCEERLYAWLDELEKALQGSGFLVGDRFSQAEISVYPRVAMVPFIGLAVRPERHPAVARWMERLAERPSFAQTLSEQDAGLTRLSRTPVLPWLRRSVATPPAERSLATRAGLFAAKQIARRVLGDRPSRARDAGPGPKPIRLPARGSVAPGRARRAERPALSDEWRAQPLTLYDYAPSPHGRRIRVLLREKGIPWRTEWIDMGRMAHKAPAFRAVNPYGELPVLRHGDRVIHDSQVIAEYLDRGTRGRGPQLYPDDAHETARVRMWLALEAGTHKEFRPLFYLHVVRPRLRAEGLGEDDVDAIVPAGVSDSHRDWLRDTLRGAPRFDTSEALARSIILSKLDFMEARLDGRAFLVGDHFTMADVAWVTRLDLFPSLGIELDRARHPNVVRWHRALRDRPCFTVDWRTHPQAE